MQGANVLAVYPAVPARTLKELIALAKAKPGQLNFASSGIGSEIDKYAKVIKAAGVQQQ